MDLNDYLTRAEEVISLVGLDGKELVPSYEPFSHGEKRKLEIGIMLASDPKLLLLDEPTAGMSSEQVPALLEIIQEDYVLWAIKRLSWLSIVWIW